jgi:hypothetical protein
MIDSYRFGQIVIDGQTFTFDVIIYPDHIEANWWRKEGHKLQVEDIQNILKAKPDIVVVGTGAAGQMRVMPEAAKLLEDAGIKLIARQTGEAWKLYNELAQSAKVAAALHLTC